MIVVLGKWLHLYPSLPGESNVALECRYNNAVSIVSGVQKTNSVIIHIYIFTHIHIYILFHFPFYYGLLQDIEYSSPCYTVGSCFFILYITVCICQYQTPILPFPSLPIPSNDKSGPNVFLAVFEEYQIHWILYLERLHVCLIPV